jgi:hypothetical protein
VGSANAWVASNKLNVDEEGGGEVWAQGFSDDDYMFQADVWMRYQDSNNTFGLRPE